MSAPKFQVGDIVTYSQEFLSGLHSKHSDLNPLRRGKIIEIDFYFEKKYYVNLLWYDTLSCHLVAENDIELIIAKKEKNDNSGQ